MPAYVESMMSVRQPPWHGQGIILDEYPETWDDARKWAGMDWEPVSRPVLTLKSGIELLAGPGKLLVVDGKKQRPLTADDLILAEDHQGIVRDDDNGLLSVVSKDYSIVTHGEMGEFVEGILGVDKALRFETAGVLKGGKLVWALVYLDEPYRVAGDDSDTLPFLAILNGHDGMTAFKAVATQVRVVCWNTYQAASMEGDRTGRQFIFQHVGNIKERIEEAKAALAGVRGEVKRWQALSGSLYDLRIEDWQFQAFTERFIPDPREHGKPVTDKVAANIDSARKMFRDIYLDSPTTVAHRETALGLVDASVEYLDHIRGTTKDGGRRGKADTYLGRSILALNDDGSKRQVVRWAMEAHEVEKPKAPARARATRTRKRA